MKKFIFPAILVIVAAAAFLFRLNYTNAKRIVLTDGNLYSISNTLGEKNFAAISANKDIKILFDQKNDKIIYGKSWESETVDSESIGGTRLYIMNIDGTNVKNLTDELITYALFDYTGQKVYYTTRNLDLYSVDATGANNKLIMSKVSRPEISADGKYLVYQKLNADWELGNYYDNALGLAILDLTTDKEKMLTNNSSDFSPMWTPLGKILFFSASPEGLASHFIMNDDGSNRIQLTNIGEKFVSDNTVPLPSEKPIWSSDGQLLVYQSDWQIWKVKLNATESAIEDAKNIAYGRDPAWLVDGRLLTVVVNNTNIANQTLVTIDLQGKINN